MKKQVLTVEQLGRHLFSILNVLNNTKHDKTSEIVNDLQAYIDVQKLYKKGVLNEIFRDKYTKFYQLHLLTTHLKEGVTPSQAIDKYFKIFQFQKQHPLTFDSVINDIFNDITECWYGSFASKLIATVDESKAVLDNNILSELQISHPSSAKKDLRYVKWVKTYKKVNDLYQEFIATVEGGKFITEFDETFPELKNISDVKKIDVLLWENKRKNIVVK